MTAGEIYLANLPFGGGTGMKLRPVLVRTLPRQSLANIDEGLWLL